MKKEKGITLIALVITIIIMLILAGIVISLTIGENGIMKKAEESGIAYSEAEARQKLELVLLDMQADKVTNKAYNQDEYLTNKIEEKNMIVNGDIVFVDGWQFQIDRSIPKIVANLGKGEANQQIKLAVSQTVSSDYVKSMVKIEIEYEGEITYIQFGGEEIEVPEKKNGKYLLEKEVTVNGNYSVFVKDKEDKYQMATIKISDISEDINIYTTQDLVVFRDRINKGATYEGKTIKVMNDLDLSNVCGETIGNWEPISKYQEGKVNYFKGTFNGNYHTIRNIWINSNEKYVGLFGYNYGKIENIKLIGGIISSSNDFIGGITAANFGQIERCYNGIDMLGTGNENIGGITGHNYSGKITGCYNSGNINSSANYNTGGIAGANGTGYIIDCYNTGNVTGKAQTGGIVGANYATLEDQQKGIFNCYNIGKIEGTVYVGSIAGANGTNGSTRGGIVENCYYLQGSYSKGIGIFYSSIKNETFIRETQDMKQIANSLGDAFIEDIKNINNGYPILKWQE